MSSINSRCQALKFEWQDEKRFFTADDSPLTVGRLKRCDVTVVSPMVSREHLRLSWNGLKWQVSDMSTNGVFAESKLPREWDLDDHSTLQLGGEDGPCLSIVMVQGEDLHESNGADVGHRDAVASQSAEVEGQGLISDGGETGSIDESDEVEDFPEDSVLAQSTITQPVDGTQMRSSTFTKPIFSEAKKGAVENKKSEQVPVAGSAATVVTKSNVVDDSPFSTSTIADEVTKSDRGLVDESDKVTGEHAATVIGFDRTRPRRTDLEDNIQESEYHDVEPSVTGKIKIPSEIDLREPSVTGQVPTVETSLDPQVTGQIKLESTDSTASRAQAAGVVIGSAALAFMIWALISLLI